MPTSPAARKVALKALTVLVGAGAEDSTRVATAASDGDGPSRDHARDGDSHGGAGVVAHAGQQGHVPADAEGCEATARKSHTRSEPRVITGSSRS